MKNKKDNRTRMFVLVQAAFVFVVLVGFYFYNSPSAIAISGNSIEDPEISFEVESGEIIMLSRDPTLENPIILEEGSDILLPPGLYYWKSKKGIRESEVKTFEIESTVGLNLMIGEDKSIIENSGNVDLEVKENKGGITTSVGVGESVEADEEGEYYGKQE